MPSGGEKTDEDCDSCGGDGEDLAEVHRVYLTVDPDGRVAGSETVEAVERWCPVCRALYPHEPRDHPHGPGGSS